MQKRREHDLLGEREIDDHLYYGIQTSRGVENFNFTGRQISRYTPFIKGLAKVKKAAALANRDVGKLDPEKCQFIVGACDEIVQGKYHEYFVLDPIQGGAGTSTNMNANEVITNIALSMMGEKKGNYAVIHPNDHLNMSQSTNDAYPTAIKVGAIEYAKSIKEALGMLISSLERKAEEFANDLKMGRTHLQDAVPMTVGEEFRAFSSILKDEIPFFDFAIKQLCTINMGATAIGTGITAPKGYAEKACEYLSKEVSETMTNHRDMVAATSDTSAFVFMSSVMRKTALKLIKICNDLRLLASGPTAGIEEFQLPERQPGSSIMPGKVNPVIPESVGQCAFQIIGNDVTIAMGCENAQLQLNVFEPVMSYALFESSLLLINAVKTLANCCIDGITIRRDRCLDYVKNSVGIVTALIPALGYEKVSAVAKESYKTGKSAYSIVLEKKYLTEERLNDLLDPRKMV